ncbi:gluconate 2-dehydrogenase subunit 3 family protein [Emticicia fluvialis]|uniref:gluconate 2-dehydrogenase subunit 3 family protein n=1 Tax=Emticicia fluvialis TaxID=2974474 RepID=UPI002165F287|nr:gluconate 2-dehydrogenase subunit 3 family protein [Emticicia fluvialis]
MQRRNAIKNLSLAFGGLVSLPSWASGWTPESIGTTSNLPFDDEALLGEIVETIIPETSTPGAKSLKVHQFALRMINDCYGEAAQKNLKDGLKATEALAQQTYQKSFTTLDSNQKKALFTQMLNSSDTTSKTFANTIKRLTIQGYTNSEFYMVNVIKFNMAPGFYHGCVPVKA